MRGLFIGRFQPPHKAHLIVIKNILQEVNELIIVIGSAQFNYILKDPFTAGERIWMLREAMKEYNIDLSKVILIPLNNIENNAVWVSYLKSYVPPFDIVYTGNPFVAKLFQDNGIKVKLIELIERDKYSGTRIRELMIKDDESWKDLVPKSVVKIIELINGVKRLKIAALMEAEPHKW